MSEEYSLRVPGADRVLREIPASNHSYTRQISWRQLPKDEEEGDSSPKYPKRTRRKKRPRQRRPA